MVVRDALLSTRFMLLLSIVAGFLLPGIGSFLADYIVVFIVVLMTVSMRKISVAGLTSYDWRDVAGLLAANYVLLSTVYFGVAWLFFDGLHRSAVILLGLMPPAVGIISLTYLLDGELETSFVAEFSGYVLGLALIPVGMSFVPGDAVSVWSVAEILLSMMVLPFVLSRGLRWADNHTSVFTEDRFKLFFNVTYASTFFGSIALNRDEIIGNPRLALMMAAVLLGVRLVLSTGVHLWLYNRLRHPLDVDYVLFTTFKNGGAAIGFAIFLFGPGATLPLAVNAVVVPMHIVFVESVLLPGIR